MKNISVIIPTYNEEYRIWRLLKSLKEQTYKNFEVIVVDDKSTDSTVKIAKWLGAKVLISGKHNLSYSRNLGIKKSKGKVIVCLDADYEINKEFLMMIANDLLLDIEHLFTEKNAPEAIKERDGLMTEEHLVQDTLTEAIDYMRTFYKYDGKTQAVRVFRRRSKVLYDESLSCFGEDICINKKIKNVCMCNGAVIYHHRFHSFREVWDSWIKYPSGWNYYKKYEPGLPRLKWFIPFFYFFMSPIITLHRLLKFKDLRALWIPIYDLVRTTAYMVGTVRMILRNLHL